MVNTLIKIVFSLLFSSMIGWEREIQEKNAGFRTCMLVCLGSTLFAVIGLELFGKSSIDIARLFYAPIIGIGFLGGGIINKNNGNLEGITTASALWVLVGVGLLCGLGKFVLAGIFTLCILGILLSKYIELKIIKKIKTYVKNK